jgi:hypothetical protein
MRLKVTAAVAATSIAALGMVGCSSAQAACDATAMTAASTAATDPGMVFVSLDGFECSDGWAYTAPTVGPVDGSEDGQYTMTMVFKADGQSWVPQDRGKVCGTVEITDGPAPYPKDSQVPEAIWQSACQTN